MHDLIGAYQRIDRLYHLYIKSAFPLRSSVLSSERENLLTRQGILSQPPLVETVPVYPQSGLNLDAATRRLPPEYAGLARLAQKLFPPQMELYSHQWDSLQKVLVEQKDIVVTTGTGSGKTECFLLPLIAQLAKESGSWDPPNGSFPRRQWWNIAARDGGKRVSQWAHVARPKALRAVILYPLNALVEDQLRRLRMALDDDIVHWWLDKERAGNRITFGRYTGLTPVSGPATDNRRERLRKFLQDVDQQRQKVLSAIQSDPTLDQDIQYYFPRLDGGEMWSRWDMQDAPPDILITNYSMLNIMMMRSIEDNIFEATREWLAEENHPERVFFLIVDELHAYRGTPGTEVAYILRLLLSRLGLTPDSPKLRILTTTASLESDERGRKFLREFFGRDNFAFINQEQVLPDDFSRTLLRPYQNTFAEFAKNVQPQPSSGPPDITSTAVQGEMDKLAARLGEPASPGKRAEVRLGEALFRIKTPDALRDACRAVNKAVRPTQVQHLDQQLFPAVASTTTDTVSISHAMRGLMLALGMSQLSKTGRSPQSVRGHLFFHHLQNLWACCNPNCTDSAADQQARVQALPSLRPTVGAIHPAHRIACSCGSRVLDLIVCEVCGDVFLGGHKARKEMGTGKYTVLTADQPDLESIPDRVNLSHLHEQYAIFWPLPHDAPWSVIPLQTEWNVEKIKRRWVRAKLNHVTGELTVVRELRQGTAPLNQDEIPGWLYQVAGTQAVPAMPTRCPRCDSDYRRKKVFKSPLRNHRTGFQKACQVIASALFREMDSGQTSSSLSRKLVIFSDSRQDAAKLAAGMERDHFRDMVRLALLQAFRRYWDDLVAYIREMAVYSQSALPTLKTLNPLLYAEVMKPGNAEDVTGQSRFVAGNSRFINEANLWFMGAPAQNQQARQEWLALLQIYPNSIPLTNLSGAIRDRLLELGICPGGSEYEAKGYGQGSDQRRPWFTCYDWNAKVPVPAFNRDAAQSEHIARMEKFLMSELMYALFPHMARTLEGLGQGWVSYHPYQNPSAEIIDTADAIIRQLGVRRLHEYAPYPMFVAGNDSSLRGFSSGYVYDRGSTEVAIQQQLLQSKAGIPSDNGLALSPNHLTLMPPPLLEDDGSRVGYRCERCSAFYLHDVKYCPECQNKTPVVQSRTKSDFDYYTDLTERMDTTCFRMNCEELTGQTDNVERPKRQRWFQNIFIADELHVVQGIDLLSVTTTMEAGVDIGALNAVMMANMPPRRFNYQQRVGRAGRRASSVSLAVTFCRGRSHDDFYYQRPESMTGDAPPSPYVDMTSESIYKRVLVKEILRQAFASIPAIAAESHGDNVHGEFGLADEWPNYAPDINRWLQNSANQTTINSIIQTLCIKTPWEGASGASFRTQMNNYLLNELLSRIKEVIDNPAYTQEALSERLANAGLLPMFGFPTRVRSLHTRWPSPNQQWPPESGTIERDLDVAISQFAPGSQTVKDKAVHTAIGVVDFKRIGNRVISEDGLAPPLSQFNQKPTGLCDYCQAVVERPALSVIPPGGQEPQKDICPVCNSSPPSLRILDAREPRGFFTDLNPDDFDGQFEWQPRSTRPSLGISTPSGTSLITLENCVIHTFKDHILSLNDDGGQGGFDFQDTKVFSTSRPGAYAVPTSSPAVPASTIGPYISVYGPSRRVALLSRRMTDILLVGIDSWPTGIFADPTTVVGRAAWYSFAFLLRTAAAAHLDIDTLELQAGFRSTRGSNNTIIGQAFLSDQLENGAGYCQFLGQKSEFERLLLQGNPIVSGSLAAKWADLSSTAGVNTSHAIECDTSCNRCLRDFQNLPYHGLLDWRLALDMMRFATSSTAAADVITSWHSLTNPWVALTSGVNAPVPSIMKRLLYGDPVQFGNLRGYIHQLAKRKEILIERHPLWQDDHPSWLVAKADAEARYRGYTIHHMNPFIALRRPSDYA